MHSRSHKALSRVLLTRTQVVIQVVQWHFKVPDSLVDASEISPRSRALSAPCTFYSFLQLYLEYLYLCIRICIWVFVFAFVHSYLYLMHSDTFLLLCNIFCEIFLALELWTLLVVVLVPDVLLHPVRISHNRERDSSATYHMPNYLWQICPLWSFLWQITCPPCSCSLVLLTRFQPRHFGPKRMKLNLTIKHGSLI